MSPSLLFIPVFLLGFMGGGFAAGLLALLLHKRLLEELTQEHLRRLAETRRRAYGQGYEHRAALEFAAREEQA